MSSLIINSHRFGAPGPTGSFNEGFDAAGAPADWTSSGTGVNFDYTTTPAPLVGSQSLLINNNTSWALSPAVANPVANMSGSFVYRASNRNNGQYLIAGCDAAANFIFRLLVNSSGNLRIQNGDGSDESVSGAEDFLINQTYTIYFDYITGSGSNGTLSVYIAAGAGAAKPGSPALVKSNLTTTSHLARIRYWTSANSTNAFYDSCTLNAT